MKIIIAGGGTGGHIFPGLAVAEELQGLENNMRILFVGSKKGLEKEIVPKNGYSLFLISGTGIKGKGIFARIRGIFSLLHAFVQGVRVLDSYQPNLVLGTGGYAAAAVCLMAALLRIPVAIQEQNAVPGLTNRILGKFARRVFLSFPGSEAYFHHNKTVLCGNPVRRAIATVKPLTSIKEDEPLRIFVFGGSQGAHHLNQTVVEALPNLQKRAGRIEWIHQTGLHDLDTVKRAYNDHGFRAQVEPFFDDMATLYSRAHLIIARSGAGIMEIAACGRPSILIPFPFATDDHQTKNAAVFAENGAAVVVSNQELTSDRLIELVCKFNEDRQQLLTMAAAARKLGRADAAKKVAQGCLDLAPKRKMEESTDA